MILHRKSRLILSALPLPPLAVVRNRFGPQCPPLTSWSVRGRVKLIQEQGPGFAGSFRSVAGVCLQVMTRTPKKPELGDAEGCKGPPYEWH